MAKSTTKSSSVIEADKKGLPAEVAEQYSISEGTLLKFYCTEFGLVDLTTVTIEFAEQLASAGYLKKL